MHPIDISNESCWVSAMTCDGRPGGRNRRSGKGSGMIAWGDPSSIRTWKRAIKGREKRARIISRRIDVLS
ncbi:hypothetical protein FRC16_005127, partial [Serendipita sp. 398]